MHHISLHLSPKQASKLRNGHKVRVKKGEGFNLVVRPESYHIMTRAFSKGKGAEIALSPEEIELNKSLTPELHQEMTESNPKGAGLFKHKKGKGMWDWADPRKNGVSKAFEPAMPVLKTIGKEIVKEAVPYVVDYGKDYLKAGVTTALGPAAPLINRQIDKYADKASPALTDYATSQIGSGLRRKKGRAILRKPIGYARPMTRVRGYGLSNGDFGIVSQPSSAPNLDYLRSLDRQTGSHYSNMARSTLENAKAGEMNEHFSKMGINQRREAHNIMGNGVRVVSREGQYIPQALMSQPLSANYQFRHFFPVNFQLMTASAEHDVIGGMGLGMGLYL